MNSPQTKEILRRRYSPAASAFSDDRRSLNRVYDVARLFNAREIARFKLAFFADDSTQERLFKSPRQTYLKDALPNWSMTWKTVLLNAMDESEYAASNWQPPNIQQVAGVFLVSTWYGCVHLMAWRATFRTTFERGL